MIAIVYLVLSIGISLSIEACNLCIGTTPPRFLQQQAPHYIQNCNCPCWNYKQSENHTCFVCGHRVLPESVQFTGKLSKKRVPLSKQEQKKQNALRYKRYSNKQKATIL